MLLRAIMGRLLVVEEAHAGGARGIVVTPRFVPDPTTPRSLRVRLRLPSGEERGARAELQVSHVRGPLPPFALLRLPDLTAEDVPPGTEVWIDPA